MNTCPREVTAAGDGPSALVVGGSIVLGLLAISFILYILDSWATARYTASL